MATLTALRLGTGRTAVAVARHRRGPAAVVATARRAMSTETAPGTGGGSVQELGTLQAYNNFPREKSVVYFTAAWCPPCRRIGPFFQELSSEHEEVAFGKVDIDQNDGAARAAGIMSVPTFMFFKGGKMSSSFAGADQDLLETSVAALEE